MTIQRNQIITARRNPNRHTQRGIGLLESSMREDGYVAPMTAAANGEVLDGNARRETIEQVFPDTEPIIVESDGTRPIVHVRRDIPDSEAAIARRIMYRANRIAEIDLSWDATQMLQDAAAGIDLQSLGFDSREVDEIMRAGGIGGSDVDAEPQIDKAEELRVKWGVESGQLWQLGEHRLICGDCTDRAVVERVMQGDKARLVVTDPPYGVEYADKNKFLNAIAPGNRIQTPIDGDHGNKGETQELWRDAFEKMSSVMDAGAVVYCFMPQGGDQMMMMMMMMGAGIEPRHELIWLKNNHVLGRVDYAYKHEPILYAWKEGGHKFYGGFQTSIIEVDKPQSSDLHPTTKPVELIDRLVANSSLEGEIIYDPFVGSGTTIIACERLSRKCRAVEIAPGYVAVCLQRWADATGRTPILLS